MSFIPIYRTLVASPKLALLIDVQTKAFEDVAPYGTAPPYIVWQTISGQSNNHLDEPANFDNTQYQLMVYATDAKTAYQIRDAARTALEQHSWVLNPTISQHDNKAKLYGRGFDANWILAR